MAATVRATSVRSKRHLIHEFTASRTRSGTPMSAGGRVEDYVRGMRRLTSLPVDIVHAGHDPVFDGEHRPVEVSNELR